MLVGQETFHFNNSCANINTVDLLFSDGMKSAVLNIHDSCVIADVFLNSILLGLVRTVRLLFLNASLQEKKKVCIIKQQRT